MPLIGPYSHIIPDGTIDWVDLASGVVTTIENARDLSQRSFVNTVALALELQALTETDVEQNMKLIIDTFNDTDEIDPSSSNYVINEQLGYVSLSEGGDLSSKESTKLQFDEGTFTNTESFEDIGGDGALRKQKTIDGTITVLEDFEDTSNVVYPVKNTIFTANFEDGLTTGWTFNPQADGQTGLSTTNIIGSYGIRIDANDRAYSPIFDCSGKTGVKFKLYVRGVSLEGAETMVIGWYDGTTWQTVGEVVNNQNGYVEFNINDAWLSASNQIAFDLSNNHTLFGGTNAGNDSGYFDEIEIYYISLETLPKESSGLYVHDGTYSGKILVDFTENVNQAIIQLTSTNVSLYKYFRMFICKPSNGVYKYKITITDGSDATWTTGNLDFPETNNWFEWVQLISGISGIDKTDIVEVKIELIETLADTVVFDETYDTAGTTFDTFSNVDTDAFQAFNPTETITVGRIEIAVRRLTNQPRVPFYLAITNVFGTTLAVARFDGNQVPSDGSIAYIIADFDNNVTLYEGNTYKIMFYTSEDTAGYFWNVKLTANNFYPEGDFFFNGSIQARDFVFRLFKPRVSEYLYIDNLQIQAESTYEATGSFQSQAINFGLTPESIGTISFTEQSDGTDTVQVRVRFAATEVGLSSASWSSWYASGQDLSALTPYQWFQYELQWISGDTVSSDVVKDVTLTYTVVAGSGNAIIISTEESETVVPTKFVAIWEAVFNSGTINFYISRDGKLTWQSILESQKGQLIDFTSGPGTKIHMKAIITGNAKLYGWSVGVV